MRWVLVVCLVIVLSVYSWAQWPRTFVKTTCLLGWTAPTTNSDASPLTDLSHFRACVADVPGGACLNTYQFSAVTTQASCPSMGLAIRATPYYVRVYAVDSSSNQSAASNEQEVLVTEGRTFMAPP